MNITDLMKVWESSASGHLTAKEYQVRLPLQDAAKIAALVEMYPRRNQTEIITELLTAALNELERAMPYIQGSKVIAQDDQGDPIYEDIGPTPRFINLSRKYRKGLEKDSGECAE
ncbi:MAG: type 1 pili tip component [Sulfuriferula sp.]